MTSRSLAAVADNGQRVKYLVPVIDMANHATGSLHRVEVAPGGRELRLVAGADVRAGDEIFISYGSLAPDELALHYGFWPAAAGGLCSHDRDAQLRARQGSSGSGAAAAQLRELLAQAEGVTSVEEDDRLLGGEGREAPLPPGVRLALQTRAGCKRALRTAVADSERGGEESAGGGGARRQQRGGEDEEDRDL